MWRSLAIAVLVYGYGHPALDMVRPAALDQPLQAFYREVNQVAHEGKKAITSFSGERSMRYVKDYIDYVEAQLREGK
jgi:hypothetical protein